MSWTQMGKSSMPAAPWKQFEALIERLKETDRYHNFLWTTTIITTKITTTLMTWQIKSSPCTFSPTCGARSWVRPSQRPSCCKTSFIYLWPSCIFSDLIISIAKHALLPLKQEQDEEDMIITLVPTPAPRSGPQVPQCFSRHTPEQSMTCCGMYTFSKIVIFGVMG